MYAKLFHEKVLGVYEECKATFDHVLSRGERLNLTRKIANELWEKADAENSEEARKVAEELEKGRVAREHKEMADEDVEMGDQTDQRREFVILMASLRL